MSEPLPQPEVMCLNGEIIPTADAKIHILSPAVKYAANIFEGIRGYWNEEQGQLYIFRLTEHLERLRFGMRVMRMDPPYEVDYLRDRILETIRANDFRGNVFIRLYAFIDAFDGEMNATGPVGMAVAAKRHTSRDTLDKGWDVAVSSWARVPDHAMPPRIKCVANYNNSRLALAQAKLDGYDNAILLTQAGKVSEGPGACLMLVRDGQPVIPDVTSDILESVTRRTIIQLFREDMGLDPVERSVGRTELYGAEEAFYCGTGYEVTPIATIDRVQLGDGGIGPVTSELHRRYHALVRGETNDHAEWLTPVY